MRPLEDERLMIGVTGFGCGWGRGVNSRGVMPVFVICSAGYVRRSGDDCSDLMRRGAWEAVEEGAETAGAFVQPLCSPKV